MSIMYQGICEMTAVCDHSCMCDSACFSRAYITTQCYSGQSVSTTLIARSMGQHGAHLGPTGPRWAPCWPHELCYLGIYAEGQKLTLNQWSVSVVHPSCHQAGTTCQLPFLIPSIKRRSGWYQQSPHLMELYWPNYISLGKWKKDITPVH